MNNKELKKLNRKDLLEIVLAQTKRIEELEIELSKANKKLDSKKIILEESGSIAEATVKLSDIFSKAQSVADDYVANVKENINKYQKKKEKEIDKEKEKIIKKAKKDSEKIKLEADNYIKDIEQKAKELVNGNKDIAVSLKKYKRNKK